MVQVVVAGASGRLGSRIVAQVRAAEGLELKAEIDMANADSLEASLEKGAVFIEAVPNPKVALEQAESAAKAGAALLIATTGLSAAQRGSIEALSSQVPVLIAPNLSPGVTVLLDLVERASKALADYDLELVETHHRKKVDAPSGTAWALARAAAKGRGQDAERDAILARSGEVGPRGDQEIGIQTLRGGDVIGDHTVFLFGETERLELTHRAATRDVFASGAVRAAKFLGTVGPGLYTMKDALGLS